MYYLQYDTLTSFPELFHGSFLRYGGTSRAPYDSLNMGENVGDDPVCVAENFEKVRLYAQISACARLKQVHGTECHIVHKPGIYTGDCLITQKEDIMLMVRHADCQAALLYDPETGTIAAVHAGWRGLIAGVYGACVDAMRTLKVSPENLVVAVCPSLGPCHARFSDPIRELPKWAHRYILREQYLDLWALGSDLLLHEGIGREKLHFSRTCTFDAPETFFSYRRDGTTGRHASIIGKIPRGV